MKKGHDAAMAVIRKAYGRAPERFYFIGGSQGGHEALDAAARYPQDYDGVVAHYPAYNVTMLHLGSLNVGRALYAGGGAAWMDAEQDEADHRRGLREVRRPRWRQGRHHQPRRGVQRRVRREDTALSPTEPTRRDAACRTRSCGGRESSHSDYKPGFTIAGMDTFPRWALLEGALFASGRTSARCRSRRIRCRAKSRCSTRAGDQTVKFIITRNPKLDTMTFDPKQYQSRIATVASIMDVTDVSLEKFRAKGGKIIMTHGTADDFITPHNQSPITSGR